MHWTQKLSRAILHPERIVNRVRSIILPKYHQYVELRDGQRANRTLSSIELEVLSKDRPSILSRMLQLSTDECRNALAEIAGETELLSHLETELSQLRGQGLIGMTSLFDCITLYAVARLIGAKHIVETGVEFGTSTVFFLLAIQKNGGGSLTSIDLPNQLMPVDQIGKFVPMEWRNNWQLCLGDSKELLPRVLDLKGQIDIFHHDSVHRRGFMLWEYRTAWPHIRLGGALTSHDVARNDAFQSFARTQGINAKSPLVIRDVGIVRKAQA